MAENADRPAIEHGGKIDLRLGSATPDAATYEIELRIPEAIFRGSARVTLGDGGIAFNQFSVASAGVSPATGALDSSARTAPAAAEQPNAGQMGAAPIATEQPPEWLLAYVRTTLRAAVRTSQAEGRLPRRITRWRPIPGA